LCEEELIEITTLVGDSDVPLYIEDEKGQSGDPIFSKALNTV
jgi:hypothetical protein